MILRWWLWYNVSDESEDEDHSDEDEEGLLEEQVGDGYGEDNCSWWWDDHDAEHNDDD